LAADAQPTPLSGSGPLLLALGGCCALAAAVGIGRFVYTPILPVMMADLGMSKAAAGLLASANFLGYLAGALLAATRFIRGSRRGWLLAALAMSALTTGAMAFVSSGAAFLALRFAGGLASAFALVFASALVLDRLVVSGKAGYAAVHFGGVGAGIALSALLVSGLAFVGGGWREQWLAGGIASALATYAASVLIRADAEGRVPAAGPRARAGGRLVALVVAYGLFGFGYVITATFLVAIVRASEAVRALEPAVWLVVGLSAAPSVALWTWADRKIGIARAFALACALEASGVAASVLWLAAPGVLLAAVSLGGTFMGITALGLVWARRLSRGDPRRTLALMTAAFGLGQIVGPAFAGALSDATGSFLLPSLAAAAALVVAALLALPGSAQPTT